MNHSGGKHEHGGHHQDHHHDQHHHGPAPSGLQKHGKWFVLAVVLMLVGIGIYVMTLDEAVQPGGQQGEIVPADAP